MSKKIEERDETIKVLNEKINHLSSEQIEFNGKQNAKQHDQLYFNTFLKIKKFTIY